MGSTEERVIAVIMVGGPTKGTRFRPLSLNIPKPLFPLAGRAMVYHPISACKRIPNLAQIYLIGFYEEREFALFVSSVSNELRIPVRYLKEDKPHGSAGGLYNFRDLIMEDNPSHIVLLNCDVCCSFPLPDMLEAHRRYGGMGTILVIKVSPESAYQFGELVADPVTNELLHYAEKPETFVSDRINCGVYIFTPDIFSAIQGVSTQRKDRATLRRVSSFEALQPANRSLPTDFVRLDQDILSPLTGKKQLYVYETMDFWEQIKNPGMSLKSSGLYLTQFRFTSPHLLASGDGTKNATISGDVYIHPSAKVHPTAKIGPNVSISANARIGAGVRLVGCIILDDVEIQENAVVIHAIIGWKSSIGRWSRVQASGDYNAKLGVTILGESVTVEDEVVVINSIVLPNKTLNVEKIKIMEKDPECISYLTQQQAVEIDELLMGPSGFSVDQLMELAGLSVASAIEEVYRSTEYNRVLVICGPGNNGGDGLVAARHLHHFGYKPYICYPKRTPKPLYTGLVTQLESLSVPFLPVEGLPLELSNDFDILVDAIFGFSFSGMPRPPFDGLIHGLVSARKHDQTFQRSPVIVSVDIPSGWHVEKGDVNDEGIKPDMLVSLTAPKLCAKMFCGPHHFLGGRFVPPSIVDKFKLQLPPYPGASMCVRIGKPPQADVQAQISPENVEKHGEADPFVQFHKWFNDAVAAGLKEPNSMALSTAGKDGKPSSRMVQLKGIHGEGFVWCSNYGSRKAQEISENPHASLLFYWSGLNRQVRVEGFVQKVSDEESEQYFRSRPREIQIGPAVSEQSNVILGRQFLHQKYKELEEKYSDGSMIPRPKHWGGYRLVPAYFEFWQGDESQVRLRLSYVAEEIGGKIAWRRTVK